MGFSSLNEHCDNYMCLLIWTFLSGEQCGPWASSLTLPLLVQGFFLITCFLEKRQPESAVEESRALEMGLIGVWDSYLIFLENFTYSVGSEMF